MQPKMPDKACPISDDVVTSESVMAARNEAMIGVFVAWFWAVRFDVDAS